MCEAIDKGMPQSSKRKVGSYLLPLLSGLEVSFKKPVYSMETFWPFVGMGPVPSDKIVLVTPMIALVDEKFRSACLDAARVAALYKWNMYDCEL